MFAMFGTDDDDDDDEETDWPGKAETAGFSAALLTSAAAATAEFFLPERTAALMAATDAACGACGACFSLGRCRDDAAPSTRSRAADTDTGTGTGTVTGRGTGRDSDLKASLAADTIAVVMRAWSARLPSTILAVLPRLSASMMPADLSKASMEAEAEVTAAVTEAAAAVTVAAGAAVAEAAERVEAAGAAARAGATGFTVARADRPPRMNSAIPSDFLT
jgi:hypothetical protein